MSRNNKILTTIGLVAWVWFCICASEILISLIFRWLIQTLNLEAGTLLQSIYSAVIYIFAIVIMLGLPAWTRRKFPKFSKHPLFEKTSREELGLAGLPTWTDLLLSPVGYIAQLVIGSLLVSLFSRLFTWFDAGEAQSVGYTDLYTAGDKILAFIIIALVAPIAEEIIFRGYLYGKLRKHLNLPSAVIIVSLLFAILHGQWNVGVNVFVTSVVLCLLREITGTIYSGALVHIIKNSVAFYLLFIAL